MFLQSQWLAQCLVPGRHSLKACLENCDLRCMQAEMREETPGSKGGEEGGIQKGGIMEKPEVGGVDWNQLLEQGLC